MMRFSTRAFTIVELLIVITVIAILATLAVVSYAGLRERTYNTKMLTGVRQYYEAIETYKQKYGQYPQTSIERDDPASTVALTCLGIGYEDGECGYVTGTLISEDSHFDDQMSKLIDAPPALGELRIDVQPEAFVGAVDGIDHVSGGYGRTIQWALLGDDEDCKLPGAYSYRVSSTPPTTACEILLEEVDR